MNTSTFLHTKIHENYYVFFWQGASNLRFETSYDKGHNSSQRFIDFVKWYERNIYGKRLWDFPIAASRLYDKSEEVCVRPCPRNGVFRVNYELPNYDFVITSGKNKRSMSEIIQGIKGLISGFHKTYRNTSLNYSSSALSPSTVSLLKTAANCISKGNTVLPHLVKLTPIAKNKLLWWVTNLQLYNGELFIKPQGTDPYSDRCIQKGLGTVCRGIRTGGQ